MIRDRELARTNGHCKSFDEDVPIRTIYDFSDCDSNPQNHPRRSARSAYPESTRVITGIADTTFTVMALEVSNRMATREDDLNQLALDISTAIAKARQLKLATSAYILSMVMVEVS